MHILITGAGGQLGSELCRLLAAEQSANSELPEIFQAARVFATDVSELDISDMDEIFRYTEECRPNVIINCAAYTNVDGCESDFEGAFKANAIGARNLAIAAERIGAKLVHLSTDYVFAGNSDSPYQEWDSCNPRSIYGKSKCLGEQYVREFCSRYFIVRTAWLYGYTGKNFVKTILGAAREKGLLKVVDDQRGNPTNAADLARHLLVLAATEQYGVYHCTNNGECSWYEFACEIVRLSGLKCTVSPCSSDDFPQTAKRPAYSSLDNLMLRCTVGDGMRSWQEAIFDYITHYDKERGVITP